MGPDLSDLDKKILRALLSPNGKIPSQVLARKVGVPVTTVRRRRKRLEEEYLTVQYVLNAEKLGWHLSTLLVSTHGGLTGDVAKKLFERPEVVYIARTIGQHTIDMEVEVFVKDDGELLNLLEDVKAMDGVRDLMWTRVVEVFGRKSPPSRMLNGFL